MTLKIKLEKLTNPFFTSRSMIKRSRLDMSVRNAISNFNEFEINRPTLALLVFNYELAIKLSQNSKNWIKVSNKSLKVFAWLLFNTKINKKALVDVPNFLKLYINELNRRKFVNGWLTLYFVIMMDYPYDNIYFPQVVKLLKDVLNNYKSTKVLKISERIQMYGLLDLNAPDLVAKLLNSKNSFEDIFQQIGMIGRLANSAFCEQVYVKFLEGTSEILAKTETQFSYIKQIISESLSLTGGLKYKNLASKLIDALLMPFTVIAVEKKTKQFIKHFILKNFDDPRTKKDKWEGVEKQSLDIFLSWMVEDTLKDFFTILKHNAYSPRSDQHWKKRRAFYKSYIDINALDEAWIITGTDAENITEHFCIPNMKYGKFSINKDNEEQEFSALIMRIGSIVIVEWACIEKYRVWKNLSLNCPLFYKAIYHKHELVYSPIFESNHNGAIRGEWQDELSNYINVHTGIAIIFHEYM